MSTSRIVQVAFVGNMKWRDRSPYACSLAPFAFHLVSLNYAKLQFARFGRNCNFQNPHRHVAISANNNFYHLLTPTTAY
jgi:hypothetical protein